MSQDFRKFRSNQKKNLRNNQFNDGLNNASETRLINMLKQSRKSGVLKLSNFNLQEIPAAVLTPMDHLDEDEKFWEIVPLTKVDLSHNNISHIPGEIINIRESLEALILKYNNIDHIDSGILHMFGTINGCLRVLDMSDNQLHGSLHDDFVTLTHLKILNLANNNLTELTELMGRQDSEGGVYLGNLEELYLQRNQIRMLPYDFGNLYQLRQLNLSENNLEVLPLSFGQAFPHLQFLDLNRNRLVSLPNLDQLTALTYLDLRNNLLTELPYIPNSPLSQLFLDQNNINEITENMYEQLPLTITHLHLEGNGISILPLEIQHFQHLKAIDLSNNDLRDLPYTLGYIDSLNSLLTEGNAIRAIRRPLLVGKISKLKEYLKMRGDPIPSLSRGYINNRNRLAGTTSSKQEDQELYTSSTLNYLNEDEGSLYLTPEEQELEGKLRSAAVNGTLDLSRFGLIEIPPAFWISDSLSAIQRINFSNIPIKIIPDDFSVLLPSLNELTMDNIITSTDAAKSSGFVFSASTHHTSLNAEDFKQLMEGILGPIFNHGNIKKLSLQNNQFHEEVFAFLSFSSKRYAIYRSLEEFDLSNNHLHHIPEFLIHCRNLVTFNISNNEITSIHGSPLDSDNMTNIRHINLSNNRIENLGEIWRCQSLTSLNIENNQLISIPAELAFCQHLRSLLIYGNPQRQVNHDIIGRGTEAILKVLQHRTSGIKPLGRRKSWKIAEKEVEEHEKHLYEESDPKIWSNQETVFENEKIQEINEKMEEIEDELQSNFSLTSAKIYALKKDLARLRAAKIREERKLKLEARRR